MIDLDAYFDLHIIKEGETPPIRWMLLDYFSTNRSKRFEKQNQICDALRKKYSSNNTNDKPICTQGTLSKEWRKLEQQDIKINGRYFYLGKVDGEYGLYERGTIGDEFYRLEKYFTAKRVYEVSKYVYACKIKEDKYHTIKKTFLSSFGTDAFFSIILIEDTLILMLNKEYPNYSFVDQSLKEFFTTIDKRKSKRQR